MDEQRVEIICLMDEGGAVMNVHFDKAGTLLRTTAEKHPPVIYDARGNGGGYISPTLTGDHQSRITDYTAIVLEEDDDENDSVRP